MAGGTGWRDGWVGVLPPAGCRLGNTCPFHITIFISYLLFQFLCPCVVFVCLSLFA